MTSGGVGVQPIRAASSMDDRRPTTTSGFDRVSKKRLSLAAALDSARGSDAAMSRRLSAHQQQLLQPITIQLAPPSETELRIRRLESILTAREHEAIVLVFNVIGPVRSTQQFVTFFQMVGVPCPTPLSVIDDLVREAIQSKKLSDSGFKRMPLVGAHGGDMMAIAGVVSSRRHSVRRSISPRAVALVSGKRATLTPTTTGRQHQTLQVVSGSSSPADDDEKAPAAAVVDLSLLLWICRVLKLKAETDREAGNADTADAFRSCSDENGIVTVESIRNRCGAFDVRLDLNGLSNNSDEELLRRGSSSTRAGPDGTVDLLSTFGADDEVEDPMKQITLPQFERLFQAQSQSPDGGGSNGGAGGRRTGPGTSSSPARDSASSSPTRQSSKQQHQMQQHLLKQAQSASIAFTSVPYSEHELDLFDEAEKFVMSPHRDTDYEQRVETVLLGDFDVVDVPSGGNGSRAPSFAVFQQNTPGGQGNGSNPFGAWGGAGGGAGGGSSGPMQASGFFGDGGGGGGALMSEDSGWGGGGKLAKRQGMELSMCDPLGESRHHSHHHALVRSATTVSGPGGAAGDLSSRQPVGDEAVAVIHRIERELADKHSSSFIVQPQAKGKPKLVVGIANTLHFEEASSSPTAQASSSSPHNKSNKTAAEAQQILDALTRQLQMQQREEERERFVQSIFSPLSSRDHHALVADDDPALIARRDRAAVFSRLTSTHAQDPSVALFQLQNKLKGLEKERLHEMTLLERARRSRRRRNK